MHVLPQSRIPVKKIPLDFMIASKMNFLKKLEKQQKNALGNFK
jgi:hypothetical protein